MPQILKLTDTRKKAVQRIAQKFDKKTIAAVIVEAGKSDYLSGRSNDFKASFDWIFKEQNFVKILEGNYQNRPKKLNGATQKVQINTPVKEIEGWK